MGYQMRRVQTIECRDAFAEEQHQDLYSLAPTYDREE
jgi:hypothetical protein